MSILPAYMSDVWKSYEEARRIDLAKIGQASTSTAPEFCHMFVLPFLSWECDIDISGFDEITQRATIRAAINAMKQSGTTDALTTQIKAISDDNNLTEWFAYDGEPYHFKVQITASDLTKRFSERLFNRLKINIDKYKNERSVLDELSIELANANGRIEVAGANVINAKLSNDFIQYDKAIAINTIGGGVIDVKLSSEVGMNYPVTDIKIQGAGIWTI